LSGSVLIDIIKQRRIKGTEYGY